MADQFVYMIAGHSAPGPVLNPWKTEESFNPWKWMGAIVKSRHDEAYTSRMLEWLDEKEIPYRLEYLLRTYEVRGAQRFEVYLLAHLTTESDAFMVRLAYGFRPLITPLTEGWRDRWMTEGVYFR